MRRIKYLLLVAVLTVCSFLSGVGVELVDRVNLSQDKDILQLPVSFCVLDNGFFFIPDFKAGNIKIYNKEGRLDQVFGQNGFGPGEFLKPGFCDYEKPYLALFDSGKRELFVYKVKDGMEFEIIKERIFLSIGYDLRIRGEKILISGYKTGAQQREYDLYIYNMRHDQMRLLLPSERKYGFSSYRKYKVAYRQKIAPIGIMGFCDWLGDDAVFVWEGDLKIMKVNTSNQHIHFFKENKDCFRKPIVTKKLLTGFRSVQIKKIQEELSSRSFVSDIFVSDNITGIIYTRICNNTKKQQTAVQFYQSDGQYISEQLLTDRLNNKSYFDKEKKFLYLLTLSFAQDLEYDFEIMKFCLSHQ